VCGSCMRGSCGVAAVCDSYVAAALHLVAVTSHNVTAVCWSCVRSKGHDRHCCRWQVLLPKYGLKGDAKYDPTDDWGSDSKGRETVDFPALLDSLFELADMWYVHTCQGTITVLVANASDSAMLAMLSLVAKA
jgi:hypothetical protein